MIHLSSKPYMTLALSTIFLSATPSFAQDPDAQQPQPQQQQPAQPNGGWRKFGGQNGGPTNGTNGPSDQQGSGQTGYAQAPYAPAPATLNLPAGTWITIRVDQPLASNRNHAGDPFTGALTQPIIADGRVVARRGQMIFGRVADTSTAPRIKGASQLGLEVTEVQLVDGRQIPVKTQLIERRGPTSTGDNVGTIGVTTGAGAAIGAAAAGGMGAGLGAIAGAGASAIGVLISHGKPAVVYPETVLTFRMEQAIAISTERAPQAFELPSRDDYDRGPGLRQSPQPRPGYYARPYYGYSPFFYGPSFYFYGGHRFYYGRRW